MLLGYKQIHNEFVLQLKRLLENLSPVTGSVRWGGWRGEETELPISRIGKKVLFFANIVEAIYSWKCLIIIDYFVYRNIYIYIIYFIYRK